MTKIKKPKEKEKFVKIIPTRPYVKHYCKHCEKTQDKLFKLELKVRNLKTERDFLKLKLNHLLKKKKDKPTFRYISKRSMVKNKKY